MVCVSDWLGYHKTLKRLLPMKSCSSSTRVLVKSLRACPLKHPRRSLIHSSSPKNRFDGFLNAACAYSQHSFFVKKSDVMPTWSIQHHYSHHCMISQRISSQIFTPNVVWTCAKKAAPIPARMPAPTAASVLSESGKRQLQPPSSSELWTCATRHMAFRFSSVRTCALLFPWRIHGIAGLRMIEMELSDDMLNSPVFVPQNLAF